MLQANELLYGLIISASST